ncbi:MAG TPA: hypothetical protein PLE74_08470 [Candidatus Cloacimonadota bacterium]|nr:hypothetical protein [Candidatus Cloacimonadota bacterium]HPT72303.1 hypothetical protein [Candidatus Cloacimonadota bacterium]
MKILLTLFLLFISCLLFAGDVATFLADNNINITAPDTTTSHSSEIMFRYQESYTVGKQDAVRINNSQVWFIGGLGCRLLLGTLHTTKEELSSNHGMNIGLILGFLGTSLLALAVPGNNPKAMPCGIDPNGYRAGFYSETRSQNRISALTGGLIGTAAIYGYTMLKDDGNNN